MRKAILDELGMKNWRKNSGIVLLLMTLALELFSHGIYHSTPSLAYLVHLYIAATMAIIGLLLLVVFTRNKVSVFLASLIQAGLIMIPAFLNNLSNVHMMRLGQITTIVASVIAAAFLTLTVRRSSCFFEA